MTLDELIKCGKALADRLYAEQATLRSQHRCDEADARDAESDVVAELVKMAMKVREIAQG